MGLIGHAFNYESGEPAFMRGEGAMYDYVVAGNGVFLKAQREGMQVAFPISSADIRGLEPLGYGFHVEWPVVPLSIVNFVHERANVFADRRLETLFHLTWSGMNPFNCGWMVEEPEQERTAVSCRPKESGGSHDRAIIEIHSHHSMAAKFSGQDNADETGFRIYGVIGRLPVKPEIRMRVGVYGQFWEIPASWVMEMPAEGLRDCNATED